MTTPVVLDTNALLLPFTDGTDLQIELEGLVGAVDLIVPSSIKQELDGLSATSDDGGAARAAKAAQTYLQRCRVERSELPGDDSVLDVARRLQAMVVTGDKNLQSEARKAGLKVITPRGHGRLGFVGQS